MLEDLTVLLTERTLCHLTPLKATAQYQMASFSLQLQDSQGHARSPRNANRAQSGSLTPCKALRKNKQAFVKGRPTMTPQDKGLNAHEGSQAKAKRPVQSLLPACVTSLAL